jgi:membrane-associated phospholipid phosphatase
MRRRPFWRARAAAVLIAGALVGLAPQALPAQEQGGAPLDRLDGAFLKKFFGDFGKVAASPARWSRRDVASLGGILGVGGLFYLFDEDVRTAFQDGRTSASNDVSGFISNFGDGFVLTAALLGFYAAGERSGRPSWQRTALLGLESLGSTALIVLGSKLVIGRARPRAREGSHSFKPFSFGNTYYSMPSGHAASAWAVATVIAEQSESKTVDAIAYGMASLVALSRVHDDKHWGSDVFLGSALGYFTARKICALNRPRSPVSPSLLEVARLSFDLSGRRRTVALDFSW